MKTFNTAKSWTSDKVTCKADDALDCTIDSYIAIPLDKKEKHLSMQWNFGQTSNNETGLFDRKAFNDALIETSFLVLDYDNTGDVIYTIEDFERDFSKYTYMLYTTISHTAEKPRFRAILTLDKPIGRDELKAFKTSKKHVELFPNTDDSSFEITRWHIMPQLSEDYEFRTTFGKEYPTKNLIVPIPKKASSLKKDTTIKFPELYLKKALPAIINAIKEFDINDRDRSRKTNTRIFMFYKELYLLYEKVGYSDPDTSAKNLLLNYATNPVTICDIKNKKL